MMEFKIKTSRSGKKSRWSKKFPRKALEKAGSEKAINWWRNNWIDDNYSYFTGDLEKFLLTYVGKPVDKAFSEFLKRCHKTSRKYNLRKKFYDVFQKKSDITYLGGFYITSGIINYKRRCKKPKSKLLHSYIDTSSYNQKVLPEQVLLRKLCLNSVEKQYLGEFRIGGSLKRVYLIEKESWKSDLQLQVHYKICCIYGLGKGITSDIYKPYFLPYTTQSEDSATYLFITKI